MHQQEIAILESQLSSKDKLLTKVNIKMKELIDFNQI